VIALGRKGVFTIEWSLRGHWSNIEALLRKYEDRPVSFADASLIYADVPASLADAVLVRMTEVLDDPVVLTTDRDFRVYRRHGRQAVPAETP
jgi:predicted nucleic acid-binding protein